MMGDRQDDRHAADRERKRRRQRYGPTTTDPGMRIVMRDLARKAREDPLERPPDHEDPARVEPPDRAQREHGTTVRRHGRDKA
jgi:hypothetical protein